jgi:hypothetical protein
MAGRARPTLRCLREDLTLTVPHVDTPLEDISHSLLAKATERFADDQTPHERIAAIDDEVLFKVKAQRCSTSTCQPAGSDVFTRKTNLGYIRRTIKPAFGSTQARKVRGPLTEHTGTWVLSAHHIVRALRMGLAKA